MKKEIYPEHLTENECEEYPVFKMFDDGDSYKEDYNNALDYAKEVNGQVYTMVDGEDNHTHYLKGLHLVNRFGFCVLRIEENKLPEIAFKFKYNQKKKPTAEEIINQVERGL